MTMKSKCRSNPSRDRLSLVSLLSVLTGAGCTVDWEEADVSRQILFEAPGGAAFEVRATGRKNDEIYLVLHAALTNNATDPCHLAIYLNSSEPDRSDMPVLTGPPAPAFGTAELVFESVLAPPLDESTFTHRLEYFELISHKLEHDGELHRWVTVATCATADVTADFELELTVQFLERQRGERSAAIDVLWP